MNDQSEMPRTRHDNVRAGSVVFRADDTSGPIEVESEGQILEGFGVVPDSIEILDQTLGITTIAPAAEPRDRVVRPDHYHATAIEPIRAIEAWGLNFNLGNVVKYVARWNHKGQPLEDRIKAVNSLWREVTGEWMPEDVAARLRAGMESKP